MAVGGKRNRESTKPAEDDRRGREAARELSTSVVTDAEMLARIIDRLDVDEELLVLAHQALESGRALARKLEESAGAAPLGPRRVAPGSGLDESELALLPAILANIYRGARSRIGDARAFRWHRERSGRIDAHHPGSSQALGISVWGTMCDHEARELRELISFFTHERVGGYAFVHNSPAGMRAHLEVSPSELRRGAPERPRLPVVVEYPGGVVVADTTTTELDTSCPAVVAGRCDGVYRDGGAGCPLASESEPDHVPWRWVRAICDEEALVDGAPCPLAGEEHRALRLIGAAQALETADRTVAVALCYPATWRPDLERTFESVLTRVREPVRERVALLDVGNLADGLLMSPRAWVAGLGWYLWRTLRVLGDSHAAQTTRLAARRLPPARAPGEPRPTRPRFRIKTASRWPEVPVEHEARPISRRANRWTGPYEAMVTAFVEPASGREALVVTDDVTVVVYVARGPGADTLVKQALEALPDQDGLVIELSESSDMFSGRARRPRGVDVAPVEQRLRDAGFIETPR